MLRIVTHISSRIFDYIRQQLPKKEHLKAEIHEQLVVFISFRKWHDSRFNKYRDTYRTPTKPDIRQILI